MEGLILLVGAISGGIVSLVFAIFSSIRKSRCTTIDCGCIHCERGVMTEREMKLDYKHDERMLMSTTSTNNRKSEESQREEIKINQI